ncbi:uncharacterized protein PV06_04161 [Exophiala oligosperma]|uniref:Uncharacterized protein n=1 Tax=Exophiala oligosperma TaxID=215243 RepID=A0A0D2DJ88_9EURO|nr:uncharacterized protein PV06_04161 [Exophiala oligosperma]KIW43008.1 hypothetical protein PV06_04161 [Exophiala oligosperma]
MPLSLMPSGRLSAKSVYHQCPSTRRLKLRGYVAGSCHLARASSSNYETHGVVAVTTYCCQPLSKDLVLGADHFLWVPGDIMADRPGHSSPGPLRIGAVRPSCYQFCQGEVKCMPSKSLGICLQCCNHNGFPGQVTVPSPAVINVEG